MQHPCLPRHRPDGREREGRSDMRADHCLLRPNHINRISLCIFEVPCLFSQLSYFKFIADYKNLGDH